MFPLPEPYDDAPNSKPGGDIMFGDVSDGRLMLRVEGEVCIAVVFGGDAFEFEFELFGVEVEFEFE